MAYRWTFGKDPPKLEKIYERSTIKHEKVRKSHFIKPAESCPY